MLQMDNHTQFATQLVPLHDKDWNPVVIVIVKGTYDIIPGSNPRRADEQVQVQC